MNNYMPKSFDEILIHPKDKLTILDFFINLIKFNNDPILSTELENLSNVRQHVDVQNLKNICIILGSPGSGKSTLVKYICEKLNMKECYYEPESQEHTNFVRSANEENEYYYHPYNNFLLYSNCQVGNTEKGEMNEGKKHEEDKFVKKDKVPNISSYHELVSNNKRKKNYEHRENWQLQKIFKSESENNPRNGKMNKSVLVDISNRIKKQIVEDLVECNDMNGKIANGIFKLYSVLMNIFNHAFGRSTYYEEGNYEFFSPRISNNFNKLLHKYYVMGNQIWKKINKLLTSSHNLKKHILENSIEADKIKKEFIIDMFADDNHSEYTINRMNHSCNLHEHISINANESNNLNKSVIDTLKLYISLKEEINDDFSLANTLREELTNFIEKKKIRQRTENFMLYRRKWLFKNDQEKNELALKEMNKWTIFPNIPKEKRDQINTISINDTLNSEVKKLIELQKCKEIISELAETVNLKKNLKQYLNLSNELYRRENIIRTLESEDINKLSECGSLHSYINTRIENAMTQECKKSKSAIDLIILNDYYTHLINNFHVMNNVRGLILCNVFISNTMSDVTIINSTIVSHLKGEVLNDLIKKNNSPKRGSDESSQTEPKIFSEVMETKLISLFPNSMNYISTNFDVSNHNTHHTHMKRLMEDEKNVLENITNNLMCLSNSSGRISDDLHLPEKARIKIVNYCDELYKLNKRMGNNLIKCIDLMKEIMINLCKDRDVKKKLLCALIDDIDQNDAIVKSFLPNTLEKHMDTLISRSYLYTQLMNIDLKKKREDEKKKNYYEEHFINTRAVIVDELPLTELEYSEEFRVSCVSSMQFIFNRVNYCKQEYLKYMREKNCIKKFQECYAIHPMIIFINSYEQIRTVNTLLGIDINNSPHVYFIKLKKIHPLFLEKTLSERYYCRMTNLNKNVKQVIKKMTHNCSGDIRSCFNTLDLLNRIPNLGNMSLEEIYDITLLCQNDIFSFARKVLYRDIGSGVTSMNYLSSSDSFNFDVSCINLNIDNLHQDIPNARETLDNSCLFSSNQSERGMNHFMEKGSENCTNGLRVVTKMSISSDKNNEYQMIGLNKQHEENNHREQKNYMNFFKELDDKADMMSISEKFQVLSLLKENFIYFYNSLSDIARLFSNLSIINHSFRGIDCSNFLMRKAHENMSDDVARFTNEHFRLTYRYYITCNSNPRNPADNMSITNDVQNKSQEELIKGKKNKINHCASNPCQVKMFFSLKTNSMNKYYYHFSLVRKELYDRYIMIVLRKIMNQNVNNTDDVATRYLFFLRGNYELFSSFFPCYILLIIHFWNSQYSCEYNVVEEKNDENLFCCKSKNDTLSNDRFYFNKFCEIIYHFNPHTPGNRKGQEHITEIISFVESFITPKFIALFFPSYLKYLKNGIRQKQNVRNFLGNQAVSTETYFEMRNVLRLHDMELYSYFFNY
ncbi:hypothetical protein, conserved [Plasmodium gonderi]|uniref:Uncharacterized protein n=1 Tax=Plasmodium gonderi TaxID=77519 RepID=A0A1Y1JML3_PLAGO|nr:hypothetical protein, conserved [Plasmodium gonderi]GAW82818.1 hypothetical protein, conserved [Plasmodium gonderi]